jgi:hypothetical protein
MLSIKKDFITLVKEEEDPSEESAYDDSDMDHNC